MLHLMDQAVAMTFAVLDAPMHFVWSSVFYGVCRRTEFKRQDYTFNDC